MLSAFARRRIRPRRFQYEPRFYDAAKDERLRRRMSAARLRARPRTKQPQFVAVALGLLVVFYVYLHLEDLAARASAVGAALFGG